jgi:hypothetical protein
VTQGFTIPKAPMKFYGSAQAAFGAVWDSINAKRGFGSNANPWVFAISFERINFN